MLRLVLYRALTAGSILLVSKHLSVRDGAGNCQVNHRPALEEGDVEYGAVEVNKLEEEHLEGEAVLKLGVSAWSLKVREEPSYTAVNLSSKHNIINMVTTNVNLFLIAGPTSPCSYQQKSKFYINPSKKVWKSVSGRSFLCCYCIISIEFYIIGKPVHFPLQ